MLTAASTRLHSSAWEAPCGTSSASENATMHSDSSPQPTQSNGGATPASPAGR
ncbi:hypothetical protein D3C86_1656520 [compost metagenome]